MWRYKQRQKSVMTNIQEQFGTFITAFAVILGVSYGFLMIIDFLPEAPSTDSVSETVSEVAGYQSENELLLASTTTKSVAEDERDPLPNTIVFDRLNKEIEVHNPKSSSVTVLDSALQKGAVRHPDSANLLEEGNVFILAHSSRLPNVINKNYQAFNDIDKLMWGDTIRVFSEDTEYIYRVDRVYEAKASEVTVPIANTGSRLTLATCDSFGSRDDRFIVEASLQTVKSI